MSFNAMADLMKARLQAQAALAGVDVIVDRQKDIPTMVAKAIGKSKGNAVSILFENFFYRDGDASNRVLARYVLRTWSMPVVEAAVKREAPETIIHADDLVASVFKALQHWVPTGVHNLGEMRVSAGGLALDPRWLCYELNAEILINL